MEIFPLVAGSPKYRDDSKEPKTILIEPGDREKKKRPPDLCATSSAAAFLVERSWNPLDQERGQTNECF